MNYSNMMITHGIPSYVHLRYYYSGIWWDIMGIFWNLSSKHGWNGDIMEYIWMNLMVETWRKWPSIRQCVQMDCNGRYLYIYIENHLKNMNFHGLSSSSLDLQMVKGWEYKLGVWFVEFYHASALILHSCPMIYKLDILGWFFRLFLTVTQWHSCAGPSKNTCRRANKRQNTRVDQGRARQRGKGTWF